MQSLDFLRPQSLAAAATLLREQPDATALAGGMTLLPTMKQRLASPSALVDLGAIGGLDGITVEPSSVTIGALARHGDVAESAELARALPALAALAGGIGDPQVRNRGTLGGSLANADPAADYPAAVLALDTTIRTTEREIAADDFFRGLFETALEPGELIEAVRFARPRRAAYAKFANPASGYAVVGVFVADFPGGVRVAVTGAGPSVFRLASAEAALAAEFSPKAVVDIAVDPGTLNADIHAEAAYRAHLVGVMLRRAVAAALAGNGR